MTVCADFNLGCVRLSQVVGSGEEPDGCDVRYYVTSRENRSKSDVHEGSSHEGRHDPSSCENLNDDGAHDRPDDHVYDGISYDGRSERFLRLDQLGSTVVYLPDIGLDAEKSMEALEQSLSSSSSSSNSNGIKGVAEDHGKRQQWVAIPEDRPLGWPGPKRWQTGSYRLEGEGQLQPIIDIRDRVEGVVEERLTAMSEQLRLAQQLRLASSEESLSTPEQHTTPPVRLSEQYNACLVNRYVDGRAAIKWHGDDEKWYYIKRPGSDKPCANMVIASVSLGAERWFEFRPAKKKMAKEAYALGREQCKNAETMCFKTNSETVQSLSSNSKKEANGKFRIRLKPGSLLIMAGARTQKDWEHAVPVDESCKDVRLNLTFRRVTTAAESPILAQPKKQKKFKKASAPADHV